MVVVPDRRSVAPCEADRADSVNRHVDKSCQPLCRRLISTMTTNQGDLAVFLEQACVATRASAWRKRAHL